MSVSPEIMDFVLKGIKHTENKTENSGSGKNRGPEIYRYFSRELSQWCDSVNCLEKNIVCSISSAGAMVLFMIFSFLSLVPAVTRSSPKTGAALALLFPVFVLIALAAVYRMNGLKRLFTVTENLHTVVGIRDCLNEAEKRIVLVASSGGQKEKKHSSLSDKFFALCLGISAFGAVFSLITVIVGAITGFGNFYLTTVLFLPIFIIFYTVSLIMWSKREKAEKVGTASCFCLEGVLRGLSEKGIRCENTQIYCVIGEGGKPGMDAAAKVLREKFPFSGETVLIAADIDAPFAPSVITPPITEQKWQQTINTASENLQKPQDPSAASGILKFFSNIKNKSAIIASPVFSQNTFTGEEKERLESAMEFIRKAVLTYGGYKED